MSITAKKTVPASTKNVVTGRVVIDPEQKTIDFQNGEGRKEMTEADYNHLFDIAKGLPSIYKRTNPEHTDVSTKKWEDLPSLETEPTI